MSLGLHLFLKDIMKRIILISRYNVQNKKGHISVKTASLLHVIMIWQLTGNEILLS